MIDWIRDLRFAARRLARLRGGSAHALAVLVVGIGLSTAMFAIVDGVLLRGLPFPEGRRIVMLSTLGTGGATPADDFRALRRHQRSLDALAAFRTYNTILTREGSGAAGLTATYVTADLFPLLGVEPILGRGFLPEDEDPSAPAVAVLGDAIWRSRFDADPGVLGRIVRLDGEPMTVVGVMPPGFAFPIRQEAWAVLRWEGRPWSRAPVYAVGRLRAGADPQETGRELAPLAARLDLEHPLDGPRELVVRRFVDTVLPAGVQRSMRILLAAVLGLLLLACCNAAGLRFGDALGRARELAIRRALGADRGPLLRLILSESLALVAVATVGGLAVATLLGRLAERVFFEGGMLVRFFWVDVGLDLRAAAFAVATGGVAVLLGGLLPAAAGIHRLGSVGLRLRSDGSRIGPAHSRWTAGLVVVQVAVCFALVASSGLLVRSGLDLLRRQPAFDPDRWNRVLILGSQSERGDPAARRAFWAELLPRLRAAPEIEAATLSDHLPWGAVRPVPVRPPGAADRASGDLPRVPVATVLPGFFEDFAWPLLAGTGLGPETVDPDTSEIPLVVSEDYARRSLPAGALGARLELPPRSRSGPPRIGRVVGVAAERGLGDGTDLEVAVFAPFDTSGRLEGFLLFRDRAGPEAALRRVEREIAAIDPLVATLDHRTWATERAEAVWVERRLAELFSLFASAALVLATVGLFGVVSALVDSRRRELAIRAAVGALPRDLGLLLLGEGARLALLGLAFGAPLAFAAGAVVAGYLHGPGSSSATVWVAAVLVVLVALSTAVAGPVRAAAATAPAEVLRRE